MKVSEIRVIVLATLSLALLVSVVQCWESGRQRDNNNNNSRDILMKTLMDCIRRDNVGLCLKWKAANVLERLERMKEPLSVTEYLSFVRKPETNDTTDQDSARAEIGADLNEAETEGEKSEILDEYIWNKLVSLLKTRTIQISMPTQAVQGRKGKIFKKGHGIFLMAGMMGGMMLKMAMAKVALIAGKALLVAKIALILSLVVGLKKLLGGSHENLSEVVYTSAEQGAAAWQRRFATEPNRYRDGASMAYSAYRLNQL